MRAGLRRLEEHEQKEGALRRALEQGAASGDAGPLDFSELRRKARAQAGLAPEDE